MKLVMKVVALAVFVLVGGCGGHPRPADVGVGSAAPELRKVRIALNWFPEVEHGGYYEAFRRGFYREAGLDVELLPGGPGAAVVQRTAGGAVEFGVENADKVLFGRAEGANVVALFAPIQTSPHCIIVHESLGYDAIDDLENITLALAPNAAFAAWLKAKLPLKGVSIVPYPGNIARFLAEKKYAQQGYAFAEPLLARQRGSDPEIFLIAETGFNPYASLLIAHESRIAADPEMTRTMVEASRRGWEEYLKSPTATNELIRGINPEMDMATLEEGVALMKPMVMTPETGESGLGSMTRERWETLAAQMVEVGLLKEGAVDPTSAFGTDFL